MIFGNLSNAQDMMTWLPTPLAQALTHLKNTDFSAISCGTYELHGKDIFMLVQDVTTKSFAEMRPESHKKYIDVQYVLSGREKILAAVDTGNNKISENLLTEKDVMFYQDMENASSLVLHPGSFAIFFPSDIHRPACQVDGPEPVHKVVVKVSVALLGD